MTSTAATKSLWNSKVDPKAYDAIGEKYQAAILEQ